jgi:heme-degrading monooxygenase HmoA
VIVRVWETGVAPDRLAEYLAFARTRSRAMFLAQPGCLGVLFLRADGGRHAACTFWRDRDAIAALEASERYRATVAALVATGALFEPQTVRVWEVEGGAIVPAVLAEALGAMSPLGEA